MKSYLDLIPISARVHRRQNRMTVMCIVLAVFLVTSIFSMADMYIRMENERLIRKHGNYHVSLENISEDGADLIAQHSNVAASSWYGALNFDADMDYYINGKKTVLYGAGEDYLTDIRNFPIEGSLPQSRDEVILSAEAKTRPGVEIGDSIVVNTPAGDFSYIVSGFCKDDAEFNALIDGICVYLDMETLRNISELNGEDCEPVYCVRFKRTRDYKKTVEEIKERCGLTDEDIHENTAVLGLSGISGSTYMNGFYQTAAVLFLLILIAGVLMISSCMNSTIAQRTKFFGMMRCIGASRRQIIRFVRLEALSWCKRAVPTGCLAGTVFSWISCIVLRFLVKGEFAEIPLFGVSAIGIICGSAVGIITVLIAAHSPAGRAAKISPISAISGNEESAKHIAHAANTRYFKIETSLGIHHAVSSKKNLVLMTGSFAFTIILFFAFLAGLDFFRRLIPSLNSFTPDVAIVSADNSNSIDRSLAEEISEIAGVGQVFGNMFALETPAFVNGNAESIDLISYDEYMLEWSENSVVSGDLSKVYGDSDYVMTIFNRDSRLNVGDKINIGDDMLEVACVVSEGIWGDARATVVCSEETFMRLTGEEEYILLNAKFARDATETTVNAIRSLAGDNPFADYRESNRQSHGSYWVYRFGVYGFLAIIALITVLNIMNSISISVSAKIKQYGIMRAVGMGGRQIMRMVAAEAAAYSLIGSIVGCVLGLLLNYMIVKRLIITYFGGAWSVPLSSVAIVLLFVLCSCIAAVYVPSKRIKKIEITDVINEL